MGVEVDQPERGARLCMPQVIGQRANVRVGDGMVTAKHDRHGPCGVDLTDRLAQDLMAPPGVGRHDLRVAAVHHREDVEGVDADVHVRLVRASAHVGQPDGPGAEPGTRTVRDRLVDGSPQDGHVHSLELGAVEQERQLAEGRSDPGVGRLAGTADGGSRHAGILAGKSPPTQWPAGRATSWPSSARISINAAASPGAAASASLLKKANTSFASRSVIRWAHVRSLRRL